MDIIIAKRLKKLDLNNQNIYLPSSCESRMSSKKPNIHPTVSQLDMFCDFGTNCLVVLPPKLQWLGTSNIGAIVPARLKLPFLIVSA